MENANTDTVDGRSSRSVSERQQVSTDHTGARSGGNQPRTERAHTAGHAQTRQEENTPRLPERIPVATPVTTRVHHCLWEEALPVHIFVWFEGLYL